MYIQREHCNLRSHQLADIIKVNTLCHVHNFMTLYSCILDGRMEACLCSSVSLMPACAVVDIVSILPFSVEYRTRSASNMDHQKLHGKSPFCQGPCGVDDILY